MENRPVTRYKKTPEAVVEPQENSKPKKEKDMVGWNEKKSIFPRKGRPPLKSAEKGRLNVEKSDISSSDGSAVEDLRSESVKALPKFAHSKEPDIDEVTFTMGKNELKIRISPRKNRQFTLEFLLNGALIRPMNFMGKNSAFTYWNMLKDKLSQKGPDNERIQN